MVGRNWSVKEDARRRITPTTSSLTTGDNPCRRRMFRRYRRSTVTPGINGRRYNIMLKKGVLRYWLTLFRGSSLKERYTLTWKLAPAKTEYASRRMIPRTEYTKTIFLETRLVFRRFWVKEPSHVLPLNKITKMCYLYYRRTRQKCKPRGCTLDLRQIKYGSRLFSSQHSGTYSGDRCDRSSETGWQK